VLAAEADVQRRHKEVLAAEVADVQRRHESAARATESDAVIERIRTEFALCAAPLDAILAEIACEEAALTTTLSPSRPTLYVDAVLFNMGGGTQPSLPLAGSPALPSPDVDSQRQTVRPRARLRRRTGRRNIPRAPSLYVVVAPTHPELLQGGASYANFHHVGGSNLTLLLNGVVYSAWLDDISYSLPPTLYI
jgi:hypothetical protein